MPQRASRQIDPNGLPIAPYVTFHSGSYVVNLPDFLGLPARSFALGDAVPFEVQRQARLYRDSRLPASHKARVLLRERYPEDQSASLPALRGVTSRSRMSLGRPGITINKTDARGATHAVSATARDHANGQARIKRYSIERYGLELALRYAIRKRLQWERTLYGHISRLSETDWLRFMLFAHQQFANQPFELRQLKHRGCVRDHGSGHLSASITVRGTTHSEGFSARAYGYKHEAWVAAILRCLKWQEELGADRPRIRTRASSRNTTTGVGGVCRRRIDDGRGKTPLIAYEALVYVDGRRKPKRFSAGREHRITAMHDLAAFQAATACRRAYEHSIESGCSFNDGAFSDWKSRFGYPISA